MDQNSKRRYSKRTSIPRSERFCEVVGCDKPWSGRTYCALHYRRVLKGRPVGPVDSVFDSPRCGRDGCSHVARVGGMCKRHHASDAYRSMTAADRVRRIGWTVSATGCHEFSGARNNQGYGQVRFDGQTRLVHRVMLEEAIGEPLGARIGLHECDNPICCRVGPGHLRPATRSENARDASSKGRTRWEKADVCKRGHRMEGDNVWYFEGAPRRCRTCMVALGRKSGLADAVGSE